LVEALARYGFHAIVASGPTEDIFRVLVGPFQGAEALAHTQADLQAAGFTSFPRKHRTEEIGGKTAYSNSRKK
jgi:cell division protein FtsN